MARGSRLEVVYTDAGVISYIALIHVLLVLLVHIGIILDNLGYI